MHYDPVRAVQLYPTSIGWTDPRSEAGELLAPERFGPVEVAKLEFALKKWRSAGQLEQRPEPLGGGIVKRKDWQLWPPGGEEQDKQGRILKPAEWPPIDFVLASLDTAYTEQSMNDPSAMTVWGVFAGDSVAQSVHTGPRIAEDGQQVTERIYARTAPRVILLDAWSEHLDFHALLLHVARTCARWATDKLIIENKASGISIGQELRRLLAEGAVQDPTTRDLFRRRYAVQVVDPKNVDKVSRLYSVQHLFEGAMVYAPDRPFADLVITQCGVFPKGKHDDLVDTTSQALRHLRDIGKLERGVEITAALNEALRYRRPPRKLYPA
jgi:predicted phage terminase large subunit-like protein